MWTREDFAWKLQKRNKRNRDGDFCPYRMYVYMKDYSHRKKIP